nr:hypothetical protein [Pseudarthrobacter sp. AB1]
MSQLSHPELGPPMSDDILPGEPPKELRPADPLPEWSWLQAPVDEPWPEWSIPQPV